MPRVAEEADNSRLPEWNDSAPVAIVLRGLFLIVALVAVVCAAGQWEGWFGILTIGGLFIATLGIWGTYSSIGKIAVPWVVMAALCSLFIVLRLSLPQQMTCVIQTPRCPDNLRNLALALIQYEATKGRFPPPYTTDANGKRLHSWRTLILPYLEQLQQFEQIRLNEPWNSPHNVQVTAKPFELFHCPADEKAGPYDTSYVAIVGPGTLWDPNKPSSRDIRDGAGNTILLVEMPNSGIQWAEPRDLDLSNLPPGVSKAKILKSLSVHHAGIHVAFADGHVQFISTAVKGDELEALTTSAGREKVSVDQLHEDSETQ